jgi:hypothetical protein
MWSLQSTISVCSTQSTRCTEPFKAVARLAGNRYPLVYSRNAHRYTDSKHATIKRGAAWLRDGKVRIILC